jgi:hypothetical protein
MENCLKQFYADVVRVQSVFRRLSAMRYLRELKRRALLEQSERAELDKRLDYIFIAGGDNPLILFRDAEDRARRDEEKRQREKEQFEIRAAEFARLAEIAAVEKAAADAREGVHHHCLHVLLTSIGSYLHLCFKARGTGSGPASGG